MAIKASEGRAWSERTDQEEMKFLKEAIDKLSPEERAALDIMMSEMSSSGSSELFDAMGDIEYKHRPVDIETFIKDEYFLGKTCDALRAVLLEDLKEMFSGYYSEVIFSGSIGWGKCIVPSTEIVDARLGRRQAGDHGDPWIVPSMEESNGKIDWRPASSFDSGEKPCVKLTLNGGQSITLSVDHPVFTASGWKPAGNITCDDLVATPRKALTPPKCLEVSDEEVELTALLMADGGCTGPTTFTNENPKLLALFDELVAKLGDPTQYDKWHRHVEVKTEVVKGANSGNATTLRASGVAPLVKKNGLKSKAKDKRIPAKWYLLPDKQIARFINLFWACDGSVYTSSPLKVETTLASEGLIDDLRYLLSRLGIHSRKAYTPKKFKGQSFPAWRLSITGAGNILDFFEKVGPIFTKEEASSKAVLKASSIKSNTNVDIVPVGHAELKEIREELGKNRAKGIGTLFPCPKGQRLSRVKFESLVSKYQYNGKYAWLAKADIIWERVASVEDVGVQSVVDLSVPGTHNFVGNCIVVHNTFLASIAICRILYEISCMKDPHRTYGIAADSNISIVGLSVSEELATKVVFENIATKIDASAYFTEHFPYQRTKKELRFPGNIWVAARATTTGAALGLNVIAALIDEGNFMPKLNDPRFEGVDKAEVIYNSLKRRLKSRFQELGRLPGAIFVISSKMTNDDFTAQRVTKAKEENDPNVFVRDYALWEVFPEETYGEERFYVLVGNEQTPSKILIPEEVEFFKENKPEGCVLLEVPEEFRTDFEADLENSIRDLGGIATVSVSPYIQRREKIEESVDYNRVNPVIDPETGDRLLFYESSKRVGFSWKDITKPRLEKGSNPRIRVEKLRPAINPDAPRHVHIDAALTNDCLGMAIAHIGGWKDVVRRNAENEPYTERAPIYVADLLLRVIPPPGDEIVLGDVRKIIYEFTEKGYIITTVTLDQYQSADARQILAKKGYKTDVLSVDRTTDAYDNLKMAMYESRLNIYPYPPLLKELRELELRFLGSSAAHRKKRKVDHPKGGSKDVSDALAGACFTLSTQVETLPLPMIANHSRGDHWMLEQRQAALAGDASAGNNSSVHDFGQVLPMLIGYDDDGWEDW